jgi:hypothetical protein
VRVGVVFIEAERVEVVVAIKVEVVEGKVVNGREIVAGGSTQQGVASKA